MKSIFKTASLALAFVFAASAVAQAQTEKPAAASAPKTEKQMPAKTTGGIKPAPPKKTMTDGSSKEDRTVRVGGEVMLPKMDIVDNAVNSKVHTTLVAAVKAAGLVETLKGKGPFTVFAPTNDAFENLPAGTVETLLKPENKEKLTKVLTYHVVAGRLDFSMLSGKIKRGETELTTVSGGKLTISKNGPRNIFVKDENGNTANINTYDVYQSNGVIHSIDAVLLPK